MQTKIAPQRDYVWPIAESARWADFKPRVGDIVVNTPLKAGTTWTQAILALLISGDPMVDAQTSIKSPWIDINVRDLAEVMARLEAQDHRRQVKSHTPFDGLPYWPDLRYITVYRHPIDIHFSFQTHLANMVIDAMRPDESEDDATAFARFLEADERDSASLALIVHHFNCTRALEPRENLLRLHYADMLRDLAGAVAQIAVHVDISHPPELIAQLVKAATFDSMKANAERFTPSAGQRFWKSDGGFFDSASSNKWEGRLSEAQFAAYDARMSDLLDPQGRRWLEWGSLPSR